VIDRNQDAGNMKPPPPRHGRMSGPFCTVLLEQVSEAVYVSKREFARHARWLVA
jgi:hypothetical protein